MRLVLLPIAAVFVFIWYTAQNFSHIPVPNIPNGIYVLDSVLPIQSEDINVITLQSPDGTLTKHQVAGRNLGNIDKSELPARIKILGGYAYPLPKK